MNLAFLFSILLFAFSLQATTPPCTLVIFGATGDLMTRKLTPALRHLAQEGYLSPETAVVGVAREAHDHREFRQKLAVQGLESPIFYQQADFNDDRGYAHLKQLLEQVEKEVGTGGNRLYYLATPPSFFATIIKKLWEHQLIYDANQPKWSRVVIEKPFGTDLEAAVQLQESVARCLHESQVYRMDHYLGKVGLRHLFALRFEDGRYEPLWNGQQIEQVQIRLSEEIGIGSRAQFWEETGTLRDIFQNHLLQILAIFAMEPPQSLQPAHIQQAKIKLLHALRPFPLDVLDQFIIRAQYGPGVIQGSPVPGYKQENGVLATSRAETFVAAKVFIDNARWQGVPFYLSGGKRLDKQATEIVVLFKNGKELCLSIQPTEVRMPLSEAYEKLLYDAIQGDKSLYVDAEEQLAAWRFVTPVLKCWEADLSAMPTYAAGSRGPLEAKQLQENVTCGK